MTRFPLVPAAAGALRALALAFIAVTATAAAPGGTALAADAPAGAQAKPPPDPPPRPVLDPHYGDVLFEFFQGHYFAAITKLEVSQQFERMPHHADDAEILRGGLLLSYGMHRQASAVFEQLLARGAPPSVRDRAWYYLAKIRWQRGLPAEAAQALSHIEHALPVPLEEDRELLQANVFMALGDNEGAARVLTPAAMHKDGTLYARYNLGVALVRSGDTGHGIPILDEIGRMRAPDEERRALRDKANVALGFAALRDGQPKPARTYLERVRLDGLQSSQALLGFGWAADAMRQPRLALVPWMELSGRDPSDAAVLEAQIAVPYAYAELGADGQALERYTVAIENFRHEDTNLDATIAAIRQGRLIAGLMARNPGSQTGWFQSFRDIPLMPHAEHLAPVIAGNAFQEAFKNYRDLLFLEGNLAEWHENLGIYSDMVDTRRQRYAQRLPEVRTQAQALDVQALQARSAANATALKAAEAAADGAAFADTRERELQARLARAQATLARLDASLAAGAEASPGVQASQAAPASSVSPASPPTSSPDASLADARERLRRVAGALQWELAQAYSARDWDARKHQAETESGLVQARAHAQSLAQAQHDEPARFDDYARRVASLDERLNALLPRVAALERAQAQAIDDLAVASLVEQKERLAGYTAQAQIAVAHLYDHASEAGDKLLDREGGNAKQP